MITWFKLIIGKVVHRVPFFTGIFNFLTKKNQTIREISNLNSLLSELHSDAGLQIPQLVEQNRKMFRDIELMKIEIERIKKSIDIKTKIE
jgi:hypothetical protein